ncbi:peptidase M75 family protein [Naumannella sp. ID2617S]|nr:peptidase M75 family protein [Naumannella sp. ID2617S]
MIRLTRTLAAAGIGALLLGGLAGCTDNTNRAGAAGDPRHLSVNATDTSCQVSAAEAPAGKLTFSVRNSGAKVSEFYLLGEDGLRILGEVENIGPGLTRDLVLSAPAGKFFTACKPGMVGDGIRSAFTVHPSAEQAPVSEDDKAMVEQANQQYQLYVKDQTEQLLSKTEAFAAAYKGGQDDAARRLYPQARVHWERIETVAESFGDLDPKMDAREADLKQGEEWSGWHLMEKDLWPQRAQNYQPLNQTDRAKYADQLVADTKELYERTRSLTFTADTIANGAKGLLDEVATGKVTGEEEYWSRTDLWDFQANVDGARVAWQGLQPLLKKKDAQLDGQLTTDFAELQKLLDKHKVGDGFKTYDQLSEAEVRELSDAVNGLSEPLSKLTAAVI